MAKNKTFCYGCLKVRRPEEFPCGSETCSICVRRDRDTLHSKAERIYDQFSTLVTQENAQTALLQQVRDDALYIRKSVHEVKDIIRGPKETSECAASSSSDTLKAQAASLIAIAGTIRAHATSAEAFESTPKEHEAKINDLADTVTKQDVIIKEQEAAIEKLKSEVAKRQAFIDHVKQFFLAPSSDPASTSTANAAEAEEEKAHAHKIPVTEKA